jgi:hypothetical protein
MPGAGRVWGGGRQNARAGGGERVTRNGGSWLILRAGGGERAVVDCRRGVGVGGIGRGIIGTAIVKILLILEIGFVLVVIISAVFHAAFDRVFLKRIKRDGAAAAFVVDPIAVGNVFNDWIDEFGEGVDIAEIVKPDRDVRLGNRFAVTAAGGFEFGGTLVTTAREVVAKLGDTERAQDREAGVESVDASLQARGTEELRERVEED